MDKIAGIKAISFDADGTLWDFEKVMRHSLGVVLRELEKFDPAVASGLDIDRMISIRNRIAADLRGRVTNLEQVRLAAFEQTLAEAGRPDENLAARLNELYLRHRFEDIELYEDVLPALHQLKDRFTIGLLSNGNSYPERCGLEGLFQFVIFSQDHGVEKPDKRLFEIASGAAGCSTGCLLHVGDSLENDVFGARNAGAVPVWLNRERQKSGPGVKIDYEIQSLVQLPDLLPEN